jgi:hypothetical protein
MTKVAIIVPNTGMIQQRTVASLTGMVYHTATNSLCELTYHSPSYAGLAKVRMIGAELALKDPSVTHLLWVDSDMTFPPLALERLLGHDEDIVGCTYSNRQGKGLVGSDLDRNPLDWKDLSTGGLREVSILGFGLILIKREVFETAEEPMFYEPYIEGPNVMVGEDAYFCLEAAQRGYKTYCDTNLSEWVGHLGTMEFRIT